MLKEKLGATGQSGLRAERDIGLILLCNIIVYEEGTRCVVSVTDPIPAPR